MGRQFILYHFNCNIFTSQSTTPIGAVRSEGMTRQSMTTPLPQQPSGYFVAIARANGEEKRRIASRRPKLSVRGVSSHLVGSAA